MTKLPTKSVPFTFNRSGYYYFSRRVPADLLGHYSYPRIVQGLKTKSAPTAKSRALVAAAKLDEYWSHLRMTDPNLIGRSLLKSGYQTFSRNTQLDVFIGSKQPITLYEALETYATQKGAGKPKTFKAAAQRAQGLEWQRSRAEGLQRSEEVWFERRYGSRLAFFRWRKLVR